MKALAFVAAFVSASVVNPAWAAPDEEKLGKALGYPVGSAANWYTAESVRVGSFTHQAEIPRLFGAGAPHVLRASNNLMHLGTAGRACDYHWDVDQSRGLTVADYLARQRIMGLLIVKDGVIQVERYQYERNSRISSRRNRWRSRSLRWRLATRSTSARSIRSTIGRTATRSSFAARSSVRRPSETWCVWRRGFVIRRLMIKRVIRSALLTLSGATGWRERHASSRRAKPSKAPRYYASAHSAMLAAVVRGATDTNLSNYLTARLWQVIGAETPALWSIDKSGLELGHMGFNATLRDYGRLGVVLANDGVRPDDPNAKQIIPREFLFDATDWKRQPEAFRPRKATPSLGYGYQFWLYPSEPRRFMMLGVYGQSIFVDPALHLVIVQTGANATAEASGSSLAHERDAFWRGIVRYYESK